MYIFKKRYVRVILIGVFILSILLVYSSFSEEDNPITHAMTEFEVIRSDSDEDSFDSYRIQYSDAPTPDSVIRIEGEDFTDTTGEGFSVVSDLESLDGESVLTPESGSISWEIDVEEAGLYNMRIHYYPVEGKSSAIQREVNINGELPFVGADYILLDRVWTDEVTQAERDQNDNELRPKQIEGPQWINAPLRDAEGYFNEPYQFYLEEGSQTITFVSKREPMAIDYIELYQHNTPASYLEVSQKYEEAGLEPTTGHFIKVQAEDAVRKSSPTLFPLTDRSSPTVEPYHVSKLRINTVGGQNWQQPGQWIEWEVDVEEEGLYQIGLKRKQDLLRGIYSSRRLTVNGEVPFNEVNVQRFNYNLDWTTDVIGNTEEPYLFHFKEGKNTIRLTVTLGDIAPMLRTIESSVLELNDMYRKMLMITSNSPDPLRDYQLENRIPDMIDVFAEQAEIIDEVADYLELSTGEVSDKVAVLHSTVNQLEKMIDRPDTIPRQIDSFKMNVSGLGTWIQTVREQPLTLDYLVVASPDQEMPRSQANMFETVKHEIGAFIASYTEDYDSIGSTSDQEDVTEEVTIWLTMGRDQAQILKRLADDTFTPETGISANIRLVPPEILLPATLANEGPDIALQLGEDIPVNYAMRGAAADLTQFDDYEDISTRFRDSAILPFEFDNGVYALPEQQMFPVMFYRTDILEELGLEPPKTWDDVYEMISVLQRHNLEFYLPIDDPMGTVGQSMMVPNRTFATLLYQNDGYFYEEDLASSALDNEISINAFNQWTQFYTNYKFPLMADFPNRLRVGEMPIGIADYATYNMLTVLAPEIRGLWEFSIIPGTVKEDGSVDHTVPSSSIAAMMLEKSENKPEAWEFLKWWTDKDTQLAFGRELESVLGEAARYPTANIEALAELPWPVEDYENLESQWQWVEGVPQVLGGYFTGRHLDNAFRRVVNANENPREALQDHVRYINDEIKIKRDEFNLPN